MELYHPLGKEAQPLKEPSTEKNIQTINFPMFFFWHRIKNMSEEGRYSALFGGLLGNLLLDETLQNSVEINYLILLGGFDTFDNAKTRVLDDLDDLDEDSKKRLYEDQVYGLGSSIGLTKWANLAKNISEQKHFFSGTKDLSEYFGISINNVGKLIRYITTFLTSAGDAINNLIDCPNDKCDSLYIFRKQTANSMISKKLLSKNTLKDDKNLFFEIEYSAYYEDNFKNLSEDYDNLYWTDEQTKLYYDVDTTKLKPNATWSVLPHYSNLRDLREKCKEFWTANLSKEDDEKLSYLEKVNKVKQMKFSDKKFDSFTGIEDRFKFAKLQQGEITCGYIEHVYESMTLQSNKGTFELFLLNQLAAENMEQVMNKLRLLSDKVVQTSFQALSMKNFPDMTCQDAFKHSIISDQDKIKKICDVYVKDDKEDTSQFLWDLYDNCEHDSPVTSFDLTSLQLQNFCTSGAAIPMSYVNMFNSLYTELSTIYQFGEEPFSLTKLAMLQLSKSTMTNTVNPYLDSNTYPQGLTAHIWDPETFTRPFEMAFFVDKYKLNSTLLNDLTLSSMTQLLNKSSLFNPLVLYYTVVYARQNNFEYLNKFMGLQEKHFNDFWQYIVLFLRDYYLQGFFMKISEADLVNGIEVPFIKAIKERPVLLGGDPSTMHPVFVRLQTANYVFEKYTGKEDLSKLDNFYGMNGFETVTNDMPIFNGNVTSVYRTDPWASKIPLRGCDNFCPESPSFLNDEFELEDSSRNLNVYGPPLNRTIEYKYEKTFKRDGINCEVDRYVLNQDQYLAKYEDYHQTEVHGYFNMTSVFNFPIMISQNHLYSVDNKIATKFVYFDKEGKAITPSANDGGFYETEQRTRGVTQMDLNLHFNLEIKENLLFVGAEEELDALRPSQDLPFIIPLYNLEFWTNLPQSGWESIFGKVSSANSFLEKYLSIFLPLFLVFLLACLLFIYLFTKEMKKGSEYKEVSTEDNEVSHDETD
jgi:hypothetical protein